MQREIRVVLFCGGRGSASLIRELLRWPNIRLALLINAYDDGLSTGALRNFIPGMLGPSDFRKNLSYLLDLHSAEQYALQRLIEYRLPKDVGDDDVERLRGYCRTGAIDGILAPLKEMLASPGPRLHRQLRALLGRFFDYADHADRSFDYADCSFGNLVFAGAYLESHNFNTAARTLAQLFGSRAELVNVSRGENRSLVALKEDGTLLSCEAEIVGQQSTVPILDTYFVDQAITAEQWSAVATTSVAEKADWLHRRQMQVDVSPEAEAALESADVVIYGPGTQHSSLLPSYRIAEAAVRRSKAPLKLFLVNLRRDHDIQGLSGVGLVDLALRYLGDPDNRGRAITHILHDNAEDGPDVIPFDHHVLDGTGRYRGAALVEGRFANPADPKVHSGHSFMRTMRELVDAQGAVGKSASLDIFIDLRDRQPAIDGVLQEFLEIDWREHLKDVRLLVNGCTVPSVMLPPHLSIVPISHDGLFADVTVLKDWLLNGTSEFLVTLSGDGEYRLRDMLLGLSLVRSGSFGAVYGSRTQSRRQFHASLRAAYGEGTLLYVLSWLGAFLLTALFSLRFRMVFSDPLTGFRIFRRSRLNGTVTAAFEARSPTTACSVTRCLVQSEVEIAEIPVSYRTFAGFAQPSRRLLAGLRNLAGIFR